MVWQIQFESVKSLYQLQQLYKMTTTMTMTTCRASERVLSMCQSMRNSNWQPIELIYFQFQFLLWLSLSSLLLLFFTFLPASTGASCANLGNSISTEHINELITIIVATILNRAKVVCPLKLASRCGGCHNRCDRATHVSLRIRRSSLAR